MCVNKSLKRRRSCRAQSNNEILLERYGEVEKVNSVLVQMKNIFKSRRCNWKDCQMTTTIPCANSRCEKIACQKLHSFLVCMTCAEKSFDQMTIVKEKKTSGPIVCNIVGNTGVCKNRTRRQCCILGCEKPACPLHLYKLCSDCCFNIA